MEQKQLVFGNFSLNNIFVSEDDSVVLGPAKVQTLCLEYFIANVDVFEGSIFLSPEFLKEFSYSTNTDIYAFGVLAFYLVTLSWPYDHKDSLIRLKQSFMNGPRLCTEFNPKISDKLNFFIMKSIQLDSQERWSSFRLIIGILEGKESVKFEQLSNQLHVPDSFSSDIDKQKRLKFGRIISNVSNIGAILLLFVLLVIGYRSYFMKYETVQLPDLLDQPLNDVQLALEELNLNPKVYKYNFHPSIPEGYVVRLDPSVGRSIKQGRSVKIFVSKGRQEVLVPSFIGKTKKEMQFILQGMAIEIEEMDPVFSLDIPYGKVVSQVPLPNQYMFDNGRVQLVYSKGTPVQVDVLMTLDDDYQKVGVEFVFVDDLDSVDFDVFEKIQDGSLQSLYSGVHYGGDQFQDAFVVHNTSSIVIHLNGEEIFSNEKTDIDE